MSDGSVPAGVIAHVALRLGRLMLAKGADTQLIEGKVKALVGRAGYDTHLLIWPEGLLLTVDNDASFRTKLGHGIAGMTVDMGALMRLDHIARANGDMAQIDQALSGVETAHGRYPAWLVVLGMGITAACLARLFGGEAPVVVVSAVVGAVSTLLRQRLGAWHANPIASAFVIALLTGLVGAVGMRAFPGVSPALCLVTAGMILTPGVPLINGVRDALAGHIGMGVGRLAIAAITVVAITFGLFLAALFASDPFPVGGTPQSLSVIEDVLVAGLGAVGFALLFNVPAWAIWACILCGMSGHGLRTALSHAGWSLASGSLVGAAVAALIARIVARQFDVPPVVFAFPGIVAMIPGSFAFRAGVGALAIMQA
ncbi:MAG TPA: threonine/serine exporter family protein, partial [Rhodopila sp.]|uniref:threonine/serine ThrE exporter family protein n=1 Tax=Rhodopila sp. TaxID=2480087 RepID=UPI002D1CC0BF